jgi:hypothetical protein
VADQARRHPSEPIEAWAGPPEAGFRGGNEVDVWLGPGDALAPEAAPVAPTGESPSGSRPPALRLERARPGTGHSDDRYASEPHAKQGDTPSVLPKLGAVVASIDAQR